MNQTEIKRYLAAHADPAYQAFASKLLPGTPNVIGVRLPDLRKLAKKIAKEDWPVYFNQVQHTTFEEIMLHGMVLGYLKIELDALFPLVNDFIPWIDNWSVCDSFCAGLKQPQADPSKMWAFLRPYFSDPREFAVRFSVVMLINYGIDEAHLRQVLDVLEHIRHDGYYAKMAVAWAISICFVRYPAQTQQWLRQVRLDAFTYQKSLQKIIESRCVSQEAKDQIVKMKKGIR